ncbi:MAG: SNF2-related protein [Chitinophagaceae bacterium]
MLSIILKYLYSSGTEENIQRGKKIFLTQPIQEINSIKNHIELKVKDDTYQSIYTITIDNFEEENTKNLKLKCSCSYSFSPICRHKAAGLFYVDQLFSKNPIKKVAILPLNPAPKHKEEVYVSESKDKIVLEEVNYGVGIALKKMNIAYSKKVQKILDKYFQDQAFQNFLNMYLEKNINLQIAKVLFLNNFFKELIHQNLEITLYQGEKVFNYTLSQKAISITFKLRQNKDHYLWNLQLENSYYMDQLHWENTLFLTTSDDEIPTWKNEEDILTYFTYYPNVEKKYTYTNLPLLFNKHLLKESLRYPCDVDSACIQKTIDKHPKAIINFENNKQSINIKLSFLYENFEVTPPCFRYYYQLLNNNKFVLIKAYKDYENEVAEDISQLHSSFKMITPFQFSLSKKELSKQWISLFFDTLSDIKVLVKNNQNLLSSSKTGKTSAQLFISRKNDFFDIQIKASLGNYNFTMAELEEMFINDKMKTYTLPTNEEFKIPKEWITKFRTLFKVGQVENNHLILQNYYQHLLENFEEFSQLRDDNGEFSQDKKISTIRPPKMQGITLRNYQKEGFTWMGILEQTHHGGLLADDMGLGKTIQMLAKLLHYYKTHQKLKTIIVCPASVTNNWIDEIQRFTPVLSAFIHHGNKRKFNLEVLEKYDIILISYNTLQKDIIHFKMIEFDYAILDESQYIKNPYSKTTRAVYQLQAKHRMCLSGTPLQNYTFDIYAQMNFLNPGFLGSIENFKNRFAALIDVYEDKQAKEDLKNILNPFILRRTKNQVATELPPKTDCILYCDMEEQQRYIYEYYRELYRNKLLNLVKEEGLGKSKLHVLQGLTFLRQICNSPSLVKENVPYSNIPIKIKVLDSHITEHITEHKILIFSQFVGMLQIIKKDIDHLKIPYAYLNGQTPLKERKKQIQVFQEDESVRIFLISLKAGGVGLNLTAADYIYIVDPWWNPMIEEQAIDRAHRIGQTKNIFSYRMICKNSIEEKILLLQQKKSKLAQDLITQEKGFAKTLSVNDLEFLLSD